MTRALASLHCVPRWLEVNKCKLWFMVGKPTYLPTGPGIVGHCLAWCALLHCCCCSAWSEASPWVLVAGLLCSGGSARSPSALHPCLAWSVSCPWLLLSRLFCVVGSALASPSLQFCSAWSMGCPWLLPSGLHYAGGLALASLSLNSWSTWSWGSTHWEPE